MTPPLVSIVIPVVNNLRYNRECIESIREHTAPPYEIVVVDNHSTDGSREYFEGLGGPVRLVCNDTVRTFAESCNQGAGEARGEFLVFLNNDTYVTPGWLDALLNCQRSGPKTGIVGNKHLFPEDGRLSHAGGVFSADEPQHIYTCFDPSLPFLNRDREYQWVTAACLLISKNLFFEAGAFNEDYRNSFEDIELCFRVRELGYRVMYCHQSVIYHYGRKTPGRMDRDEANKQRFYEKWGDKIRVDREEFHRRDRLDEALDSSHLLERWLLDYEGMKEKVKALEGEKDKLENHIEELQKVIECQKGGMEELQREVANRKDQMQMIHDSLSWRVTQPLRSIRKLFPGK